MALNESGVGQIRNFQPITRRISETAQDRTKVATNIIKVAKKCTADALFLSGS